MISRTMPHKPLLLCVLCWLAESAPQPWTLLTVRTIDSGAGRYTQLAETSVAWNAVDPNPGMRLARCSDTSCTTWADPPRSLTQLGEKDPRFVRMELASGLPTFLYVGDNETSAVLACCLNKDCTGRIGRVQVGSAPKFRHVDLEVSEDGGQARAITVSSSPSEGTSLWLSTVNLQDCRNSRSSSAGNGAGGTALKTLIAHTPDPCVLNMTSGRPTSGLEVGSVVGDTILFWHISRRSLLLVNTNAARRSVEQVARGGGFPTTVVADNSSGVFHSPGAWAKMVRTKSGEFAGGGGGEALVVTFFDLETASLFVTSCASSGSSCRTPVLVDGNVSRPDLSDYGAGGFPDLKVDPRTGNPALVYFTERWVSGKTQGCLRCARCTSPDCATFDAFDVVCGMPGSGRDASMLFTPDGHALISFLDLDGKDDPASMLTRIAYVKTNT